MTDAYLMSPVLDKPLLGSGLVSGERSVPDGLRELREGGEVITSAGRFLIATPTKCGTTTLEELARRHAGGRISRGGTWQDDFRIMNWESPRRQHRMSLPPGEGWGDVTRYMMVRNPYTRYLSIYMYLKEPRNFSQWGARVIQGSAWPGPSVDRIRREPMCFETFLQWLVDQRDAISCSGAKRRGDLATGFAYRSPWVWTDSLAMSVFLLASQPGSQEGRVHLLRLENLPEDLGGALEAHGVVLNGKRGRLDSVWANKTIGLHALDGDRLRGHAASSGWAWGGILHARHVYRADGEFVGGADSVEGCSCGACQIGVAEEARFLGY